MLLLVSKQKGVEGVCMLVPKQKIQENQRMSLSERQPEDKVPVQDARVKQSIISLP